MSSERMTDLELADAVLDLLEKRGEFNDYGPSEGARVRLEALFANLRARGAL
jgi:hypothetical protein